jgi:hypothetical protein
MKRTRRLTKSKRPVFTGDKKHIAATQLKKDQGSRVGKFLGKPSWKWKLSMRDGDGRSLAIREMVSFSGAFLTAEENSLERTKEFYEKSEYLLPFLTRQIDKSKVDEPALREILIEAKFLNFLVVQLAKEGFGPAAEFVWDNSFQSISVIKYLAQTRPEILKSKTRKSLFLPSLRANVKKFTDDFKIISDAVELSADCPVKVGDQAKYDLDSKITLFVKDILLKVLNEREFLIQANSTIDEILQQGLSHPDALPKRQILLNLPGVREEQLFYIDLPPYGKSTSKMWWDKVIKPILDSEETLRKLEGTKLYELLSRGAKQPVDYLIRDYLKKLCREKVVSSLAP